MIWAKRGSTHGVPIKSVCPRISLIAALDNFGEVYACITQVNTDSKIMGLYLKELVKLLDQKDEQWRNDTIILHDGAMYAKSKNTQRCLRDMQIPYMLLAPHSYNVAPIELLFGALKNSDLNPEQLPTGKA